MRLIIAILLTFGLGVLIGGYTSDRYVYTVENVPADMSTFAEAWNLLEMYYEAAPGTRTPSAEERVYGAIEGLVRSYNDPHSAFLVPEAARMFEEEAVGDFGGVGMEIDRRNDTLVVVAPLKGTPAERAGLQPGDAIIGIDGEAVLDMSVDEAVQTIRGDVGTDVTLTILRDDDDVFDVVITRAVIAIPTVETEIIDDAFVIRLFNFSGHVLDDFETAIQAFETSDATRLVLDLRGNPGGFLDAAVEVTSYFVEEGRPIVYEISGGSEIVHRSLGYGIAKEYELAVLVNYGSASASEIVAGALQAYNRGVVVGTETFGKGSVQQVIGLDTDADSILKLTIAQWYTPDRQSISEQGLVPDIVVEFTNEDFEAGNDPQLDAAIASFDE